MKKPLCLIFLFSMLLVMTGCFGPVLKSPPEMTLTCGNICVQLSSDDDTWTKKTVFDNQLGDKSSGYVVYRIPDNFILLGDTVTLSFPVIPKKVVVSRIPYLVLDGEYENVDLSDSLSFSIEQGKWEYLITAYWSIEGWSGEATYRFTLSK